MRLRAKADAALAVTGVSAIEKLHVRKAGMAYHVYVLVHIEPYDVPSLESRGSSTFDAPGSIFERR